MIFGVSADGTLAVGAGLAGALGFVPERADHNSYFFDKRFY